VQQTSVGLASKYFGHPCQPKIRLCNLHWERVSLSIDKPQRWERVSTVIVLQPIRTVNENWQSAQLCDGVVKTLTTPPQLSPWVKDCTEFRKSGQRSLLLSMVRMRMSAIPARPQHQR